MEQLRDAVTLPLPPQTLQATVPLPPQVGQVALPAPPAVDVVVSAAVVEVVDDPVGLVVTVVLVPVSPAGTEVVVTGGGGPPTYPIREATTSPPSSSTAAVPQPHNEITTATNKTTAGNSGGHPAGIASHCQDQKPVLAANLVPLSLFMYFTPQIINGVSSASSSAAASWEPPAPSVTSKASTLVAPLIGSGAGGAKGAPAPLITAANAAASCPAV